MKSIFYKTLYSFIFGITISILSTACVSNSKNQTNQSAKVFPSDVLPFLDEWKILLGDGTYEDSLVKFDKKDFLTHQLPFEYDIEAKAPLFKKYLEEVLIGKRNFL